MPEYKNQHFVPQFHFREFTDSNRVHVFNFDASREFSEPISNVCSRSYFYSENPEVERSLSPLEAKQAEAIQQLSAARDINKLDTDHKIHLLTFTALQRVRTKEVKEDMEEAVNFAFTEYAREKADEGELDTRAFDLLDKGELRLEGPIHQQIILKALTGVDLLRDLNPAIILNETDVGLVTSDHPIVFDNAQFKHKRNRGLTGFQSVGLQVFIPISSSCLFHLYDPSCYSIDWTNKSKKTVKITSKKSIRDLNSLQFINAQKNVFYGQQGREEEMQSLQNDVERYMQESMQENRTQKLERSAQSKATKLIETGAYVPEFTPYLPFIRHKKRVPQQLRRSPRISALVREEWDSLQEKIEEMRAEEDNN